MKKVLIIGITSFLFIGCYYDKADVINPNAAFVGCDTTKVSYNTDIKPILSNNTCLTCHTGATSSGGNIALDDYASVKASATKGELLPAVRQDAKCSVCAANYAPMPVGASKISDCNINKIAAWIHQGCNN